MANRYKVGDVLTLKEDKVSFARGNPIVAKGASVEVVKANSAGYQVVQMETGLPLAIAFHNVGRYLG